MSNMEKRYQRIPVLGIILVAVGLLMLTDQLGMINLTFWNYLTGFMVLFGSTLVVRSFATGDRGKVFWGTVLFLSGLYFLLESLSMVTREYPVFIPSIFLILGFSFLMMYIYNVRDWHIIIPTVFFLGIGAAIFVNELSILRLDDIEYYFSRYWPVLLILFGLGMILRRRRKTG